MIPIESYPVLSGGRACIFDAGGTLVHPDWPRLSSIAAEVANCAFGPEELSLTFRTILRRVGLEMQQEHFVLPEEMKRPHWSSHEMTPNENSISAALLKPGESAIAQANHPAKLIRVQSSYYRQSTEMIH